MVTQQIQKSSYISPSIIISPLLMPKVIQPRRHDKELTVEDFWKIKNQGRIQKQDNVFHAYREDEVEQRHRFMKPSDQAKTFNPLAFTLKRENRAESNDLYTIGTEDENTYVGEYMNSVQNRVNSSLYEIKAWVMGRQSIIYNLEKIYKLLWSHLHIEEGWPLLQAVIKDSRGEKLSIWLSQGFKQLAQSASQTCSANFNKIYFKNFFDTMCVFMQNYYDQILPNIHVFFQEFGTQFMKHSNKYMRKFSIQAFSFILSNLQEDQYEQFLHHLVEKQKQGFFDEKVSLADMLLQRLKIVKGCLTTASLTHFLTQIETLEIIFSKESVQESHFLAIASDYIGLVLESLDCRQGVHENQILFDFVYVIKALITFSQKNIEKYGKMLVMGFSNFLALYRVDKKRFAPHTNGHAHYLRQIWEIFGDFFKNSIKYFNDHENLQHAIAVLSIKCGANFLYSTDVINYCKENEIITKTIIRAVYQHDEQLEKGLMEVILLLSKDLIRKFVLENKEAVLVYTLIVLMKRFQLNKFIELSWLQLNEAELSNKLTTAAFEDDLIIILRLLAFIRLPEESHSIFLEQIQQLYNKFMTPYEEYIRTRSLQTDRTNLQRSGYYNYLNFTKEIIIYAHHEIQWLSHIFNIYESFILLTQHLGQQLEEHTSLWDELIISRTSALTILTAKGIFNQEKSNSLILNLLSSRNREVRYSSLQIIVKQYQEGHQLTLIQWLLTIDEDSIHLDNEREVKRIFCNIQQYFQNLPESYKKSEQILSLYTILIKWCLGFAYTGFKLIQTALISLLRTLFDADVHASCSQIVSEVFMPFLEYYNYRHSRQYEFDISKESPVSHLTNAFKLTLNQELIPYIQEDLQISNLDTVEWIGLQRVADAIKTSKRCKNSLGNRLLSMIQAYFEVQFQRQKNTIESQNEITPKPYLLPIKQRFLVTILKLCPKTYFPPLECLHFTREIYFQIEAVRNIKRNNWESMWEHKKSDQPKKKVQIADVVSTTVNLEHLSMQQQKMYINYLWKDILESNRHKKRIILDHIRNYLPSATPFIFSLLFEYLHLSSLSLEKISEESINLIVARLKLMNRRSLLNGMFILKSLLIHLKQEVNSDGRLKIISLFILSIIQIVYSTSEVEVHNQEEDDEHSESDKEDEKQADQQSNHYFEYKQHRKELQKLLQTLFANHDLQTDNITELLQFLFINTKINLAKSSRLSVPGLLLILKTISQEKEYGVVLMKVLDGQIVEMLTQMVQADEQNERPLKACFEIWLQIMTNLIIESEQANAERDHQYQVEINERMANHSAKALSAVLSFINAVESRFEIKVETQAIQIRRKEQESMKFLKIITKFMEIHQSTLQKGWQSYIWEEISKLTKLKRNMNQSHCEKLSLFIIILARYIHLRGDITNSDVFLKKIIGVLPSIRDSEQRLQILELMISHYKQLGLNLLSVQIVSKMCQIKKTALITTMDFSAFFQSCNDYSQSSASFELIDHEYYLYNLVCFADNAELSVRRAVSTNCKHFLELVEKKIKAEQMVGENQNQDAKIGAIMLCLKLYRVFLQLLPKQNIQHNEPVYWNVVDNIDLFYTWISSNSTIISKLLPNSNAHLYSALIAYNQEQKSYFKLFGSLSEASKFKGLKLMCSTLETITGPLKQQIVEWSTAGNADFPNPISKIILPILEYLIFKPTENRNTEGMKSNLSSTFSKNSIEFLPLISSFLKETTIKKELKRLVSKLKFSDSENKKNIALIKMIGGLIDGIEGERVNQKLQSYLDEHGFEQFHQKITQFSKSITRKEKEPESEEDQHNFNPAKREKIPDFFDRLDELESEEAINRNFLHFDKKMMDLQLEENEDELDGKMFPAFLKKHVLLPLRTMLMMQNKAKAEEQNTKSQILLSVTITKVLLRLPLDVFLRQFQKVISRLGRLLKKREIEFRDNARNCLCEIAKAVGSQLLYAIIIELKFHLKDNFDKHVLNYSLFKILDSLNLVNGDIDYCLPLILPTIIDEIFGQSSNEKQMVQKRQVKTLKLQAKKSKGLQILQLVCRSISSGRVGYIIQFLQKYLREHLVTEVNLGKYDHMLGAITAGLAHNLSALSADNAAILLPLLAVPVTKLREQIKQLHWDDGAKHENTLKKDWKRRKAGKEQILSLQEEAGRNASIFKKMGKQIGERRNLEIIASSLIQFYLALLSFFLKRQIFTLSSITAQADLSSHFLTLLGFLGECVDQRDNRLVTKSLKTLHIALSWNTSELKGDLQSVSDRFKSIKKQTSRKILLLVQQLTLADEQLLRECFVFLNDLISEASVTLEMLPNFIAVIKLHTPTTEDQPHLPETYQLLRTLLYKCPQYLYYPLLDEMHLFVRMRLPTCRNKQIRDLSCSILSVYLRPRKVLLPSVQAFNLSQKKHSKEAIDYNRRLQQQLTFYLSNLQCTGQEGILQLLEEFISNRQADQIETYSELLLLGLMTARTNQINKERAHPADKLMIMILKSINQSKITSLVEKCLLWSGQNRFTSIRLCGVSFLRLIIQQSQLKINQNFIDKYVLGKGGVFERASIILKQQSESFQASRSEQQSTHKLDNQWNDIMNKMEVQTIKYECDPSVIEILLLLSHFFEVGALSLSNSSFLSAIITNSWKLLHSKDVELIASLINCLTKLNLLPSLVSHSEQNQGCFENAKENFSLKKTVSALIFNHHNAEIIEKLLHKILQEELRLDQSKHLATISWFLVGIALKAHIKANIYQQVLPTIIYLLNHLTLLKETEQLDFRTIIFAEPNFQEKLLELSIKLSSNSLISQESKELVEETSQILKSVMGVSEFFKAVGDYEVKKRFKKSQEKARIAEMAILNPTQFIDQKRGKTRKLE